MNEMNTQSQQKPMWVSTIALHHMQANIITTTKCRTVHVTFLISQKRLQFCNRSPVVDGLAHPCFKMLMPLRILVPCVICFGNPPELNFQCPSRVMPPTVAAMASASGSRMFFNCHSTYLSSGPIMRWFCLDNASRKTQQLEGWIGWAEANGRGWVLQY